MGGDARSNDEVGADRKTRDTPTLLRELAWVIHRTAPERSGAPLPIAEVALLKEIDDMPGVTVGELAAALGMQQPNVSAALRALERNGFIVRERCERPENHSHLAHHCWSDRAPGGSRRVGGAGVGGARRAR